MNAFPHWRPGDTIVLRGVRDQKVWYVIPVYVVQDSDDLTVVYWPAGTPTKSRMKSLTERLTPQDIMQTPMELLDSRWTKTDVLMLIPPGEAHVIYVMWEEGHQRLLRWYVNLQDPSRRTPVGFDSFDHLLDIEISPDKTSWRWKDEEELKEGVAVGMFTADEAREIRAEGERVIGLLTRNLLPFCGGWENWSPPAEWKALELPEHWGLNCIE